VTRKDQPRGPQTYDVLGGEVRAETDPPLEMDDDPDIMSLATPVRYERRGEDEDDPILSILDPRFTPTPARPRTIWASPWVTLVLALLSGIALGAGIGLGYALLN